MLKASSSWSDGDELSLVTEEGAEMTRYRLTTPSLLSPSESATKLEVKCQIDVQLQTGACLEEIAATSNARNVEVYVARGEATFEYCRTVRGTRTESSEERYEVRLGPVREAAAVRLRMLSLRGDKRSCALDDLVLDVKPAHLTFEVIEPPVTPPAENDLKIDHLATIGAQMLQAAERRVVAHLDSVCLRLTDRFEKALASQTARLDRIERILLAPKPSPPGLVAPPPPTSDNGRTAASRSDDRDRAALLVSDDR